MALDARVHRFMHQCAGNPYLEETLGRYLNLSLRIWHLVLDRLPHLLAGCTSTTTCCERSRTGSRTGRGGSSPSTSRRSSARFAPFCEERRP